MPRYKLTIEYDGTPFVGWQVQDNGASVQGVITEAIAAFTGERVVAARRRAHRRRRARARPGRPCRSCQGLGRRHRARRHQRPPAAAADRRARRRSSVADDFDARFSAIKRHYLYRIVNRRADLALDKTAPGACRVRSMPTRCTPPRKSWSAGTTSPPSAPPNARPNRR